MSNRYVLEIAVESAESAAAAERGGARRIELCAELRAGGVSPGLALMRRAREQVRIPIFAMARPRAGDFVYSESEFAQLRADIELARQAGMDGVVLGLLTRERRVDVARTKELVEAARPLAVTFHRAFDAAVDLEAALEDVIRTGAARILTSGGAVSAPEGTEALARLVAAAKGRIVIVPGGGINPSNILRVARESGARELHSGLGTVLRYGQGNTTEFEKEVRKLAAELGRADAAEKE